MDDRVSARFKELVAEGEQFASRLDPTDFWVPERAIDQHQQWLSSAGNLLKLLSRKGTHFSDEVDRLLGDEQMASGIPIRVVTKMLGTLRSAQREWESGLLRQIEYIVLGEAFDDFLDIAARYHKAGMKNEAAVLAGAVLEDAVRRISTKNRLPTGKTLDPAIDDLVQAGVLTPVKAKRAKAYAGIRNKAAHAEWDAFDLKDVGEMVNGIRELVEELL